MTKPKNTSKSPFPLKLLIPLWHYLLLEKMPVIFIVSNFFYSGLLTKICKQTNFLLAVLKIRFFNYEKITELEIRFSEIRQIFGFQ